MKTYLLRSPAVRQLTARRFASTEGSISQSASKRASQTASKAQDVAKVAISKLITAAGGLGSSLSKVGGRTGELVKTVESLIPPTIYYSKVTLELSKLVFHGQMMTPPPLEMYQRTFSPIVNALKSPSALLNTVLSSPAYQPASILAKVKSRTKQEWAQTGVSLAEVLGFYTVGTMIGRGKIVGYRGEKKDH